MLQRPQVHRHGGADGDAIELLAAFDHVAAQGARGRGQQDVVDRAAQGPADRLHFFQRQRFGPGHALADAKAALEHGVGIVRKRQRQADFLGDVDALAGQHRGQRRVAIKIHALLEHLVAQLHVAVDRADALGHGGVFFFFQPAPGQRLLALVVLAHFGERKQHLHQGDAVGVTVVDARDQRRTAVVSFDQVELPERLGLVERRRGQLAGQSFEFALAALAGQRGQADVPVEVEIGVVLPERTRGPVHGFLPETRVGQELGLDHLAQGADVEMGLEHHHAGDHHQVGGALHAQPGGVHPGHRRLLTLAARHGHVSSPVPGRMPATAPRRQRRAGPSARTDA